MREQRKNEFETKKINITSEKDIEELWNTEEGESIKSIIYCANKQEILDYITNIERFVLDKNKYKFKRFAFSISSLDGNGYNITFFNKHDVIVNIEFADLSFLIKIDKIGVLK